jgi:hypothetical protein
MFRIKKITSDAALLETGDGDLAMTAVFFGALHAR